MFSPVSSRVSFPELDSRVLQHWKERDVFRRAGTEREGAPRFMLYDGPPTANGSPGIHHVLARIFKDVMCRYKTMKGYQVLRKGGWDTHGLPVELGIEQELGLTSKRDIEEYGIEEFNAKCRESVFRYVREWEEMTDRIGFWVDMDDPYVTLGKRLYRVGLVDPQDALGPGAALPGDARDAPLSPLRDQPQLPRAGAGLPRGYARSIGVREVPANWLGRHTQD